MWLTRLLIGEIRTTRPPSLFNRGKCTHQVLMPDVVSLLWLAWHGSGLLICQDASLSRTLQAHLDRFPFLPCPCLMIREGGRKNIELNRKSVTVYMNVSDDILHEVWKMSHVDFDHENVLWALLLGLPSPLKDFEPNDTSIRNHQWTCFEKLTGCLVDIWIQVTDFLCWDFQILMMFQRISLGVLALTPKPIQSRFQESTIHYV